MHGHGPSLKNKTHKAVRQTEIEARAAAAAMASAALNGSGGGGVVKRMGVLRVQYYCVMGAVAAAVVLATLRYMPGPTATPSAVARQAAAPVESAAGSLGGRKRKEAKEKEEEEGVVLFNFGDSNSDTGGVAAVQGIRIAPPEGRAYFRHPTGRLSDGRVILDFICECSCSPSLPPRLASSPFLPLSPSPPVPGPAIPPHSSSALALIWVIAAANRGSYRLITLLILFWKPRDLLQCRLAARTCAHFPALA